MKISHLDHLVLTVKDIDKSCLFYTNILGMQQICFADNRKALRFGDQKINLHEQGKEFEPKANQPTSGSADLCFITENNIQTIVKELQQKSIPIIEGPVQRNGARGNILSVYIRDPDLNLVEIATYLPK